MCREYKHASILTRMGATSMRRTIHMSCLYPPNDQICREIARLGFNIIISKNSSDILIWAKLFSKERHFHLSFLVIIFHHFRVECSHQFLIINRQFVSKFHIPNFGFNSEIRIELSNFKFRQVTTHQHHINRATGTVIDFWLSCGSISKFLVQPKICFFSP